MMSAPRTEITVWVGDDPASLNFSVPAPGFSFLTIGGLSCLLVGFSGEARLTMLERLRDACAAHIAEVKAATPPALVG
jgi:hypothetical protein